MLSAMPVLHVNGEKTREKKRGQWSDLAYLKISTLSPHIHLVFSSHSDAV